MHSTLGNWKPKKYSYNSIKFRTALNGKNNIGLTVTKHDFSRYKRAAQTASASIHPRLAQPVHTHWKSCEPSSLKAGPSAAVTSLTSLLTVWLPPPGSPRSWVRPLAVVRAVCICRGGGQGRECSSSANVIVGQGGYGLQINRAELCAGDLRRLSLMKQMTLSLKDFQLILLDCMPGATLHCAMAAWSGETSAMCCKPCVWLTAPGASPRCETVPGLPSMLAWAKDRRTKSFLCSWLQVAQGKTCTPHVCNDLSA